MRIKFQKKKYFFKENLNISNSPRKKGKKPSLTNFSFSVRQQYFYQWKVSLKVWKFEESQRKSFPLPKMICLPLGEVLGGSSDSNVNGGSSNKRVKIAEEPKPGYGYTGCLRIPRLKKLLQIKIWVKQWHNKERRWQEWRKNKNKVY